jgi:hypothetical protein
MDALEGGMFTVACANYIHSTNTPTAWQPSPKEAEEVAVGSVEVSTDSRGGKLIAHIARALVEVVAEGRIPVALGIEEDSLREVLKTLEVDPSLGLPDAIIISGITLRVALQEFEESDSFNIYARNTSRGENNTSKG